jgi:MinD-like ATPase involved in chromosome partitioning or flagellar assembly
MKVNRRPGRIITFYSYKGGTGRSMALANVAWILASQGKRVLMVDWDLEAPGLHHYFHPFLRDKNLTFSEGVIDIVTNFEGGAVAPKRDDIVEDTGWYLPFADISKYCIPLAWTFPNDGILDLLPAGRQGHSYASRVNSFNWSGFYDRLGGGVFLETVKQNMRRDYDYILIDSRTGVSDTAGVCTVQMPDILVVCFTLNIQSIEGAAAVAGSIRSQREKAAAIQPDYRFRIFPVPMRLERAEKQQLDRAREFARGAFAGFIDHLSEDKRDQYWGHVYVPYEPFYAYQEILATIADEPGTRDSLLTSFEQLVEFLTDAPVYAKHTLEEKQRLELKEIFLRGAEPRGARAILASRPELQQFSEELEARERSWIESNKNEDYLLRPDQVARLRESTELAVAMLEDRNFREFWDNSQRNIRERDTRRRLSWYIGATIGVTASLLFIIISSNYTKDYYVWLRYPVAILSGMLGSLAFAIRELFSLEGKPQISSTFGKFLNLLSLGALSGGASSLLLTNNALYQIILIGFILGFISPNFFAFLDRVAAIPVKSSDSSRR